MIVRVRFVCTLDCGYLIPVDVRHVDETVQN